MGTGFNGKGNRISENYNGGKERMNKKEILDILNSAKDENGDIPMRLVRQAFDKLVQPEASCYLGSPCEYQNPNAEIQEECKLDGTTAVAKSKRTFVELLVHYPHPDVCTYPEYKGKPYYLIKYIEDGECFVGFGTYKPEVLSQYLRDYFMPPAQPGRYTKEELRVFQHGISLSLLSKRSSQHWFYDEDTATEIKFLERLYEKVGADMRGEQE